MTAKYFFGWEIDHSYLYVYFKGSWHGIPTWRSYSPTEENYQLGTKLMRTLNSAKIALSQKELIRGLVPCCSKASRIDLCILVPEVRITKCSPTSERLLASDLVGYNGPRFEHL